MGTLWNSNHSRKIKWFLRRINSSKKIVNKKNIDKKIIELFTIKVIYNTVWVGMDIES